MEKTSFKQSYILTMVFVCVAYLSIWIPMLLEVFLKQTITVSAYTIILGVILLLWICKMAVFAFHHYDDSFVDGWKQFYQKAKVLPFIAVVILGITVWLKINL